MWHVSFGVFILFLSGKWKNPCEESTRITHCSFSFSFYFLYSFFSFVLFFSTEKNNMKSLKSVTDYGFLNNNKKAPAAKMQIRNKAKIKYHLHTNLENTLLWIVCLMCKSFFQKKKQYNIYQSFCMLKGHYFMPIWLKLYVKSLYLVTHRTWPIEKSIHMNWIEHPEEKHLLPTIYFIRSVVVYKMFDFWLLLLFVVEATAKNKRFLPFGMHFKYMQS